MSVCAAEEKRLGRKLAAEAEALREWLRLQKAQLIKLQKRDSLRTRLRHATARLQEREAALAEWDEDSPPEVRVPAGYRAANFSTRYPDETQGGYMQCSKPCTPGGHGIITRRSQVTSLNSGPWKPSGQSTFRGALAS